MHKYNWDAPCKLYGQAIKDLHWWIGTIPHTAGPIHRNKYTDTIFSDASDDQWGGFFRGMVAQGKFSLQQQNLHINTKEVLAAYYSILSFLPYTKGNHILLRSDNTTCVANLHDMGTMISPIRDRYCRKVWQKAYEQDCWLSINFIRGVDNWRSDLASRIFNARTEWTLPMSIFGKIAQRFGWPSIDLFASRINHRVNRYVSWTPDPFCVEVDAFYYQWSDEFPYLYPPFNLWNRCVAKIQQDAVQKAIILFPLWPNQPWFPQILELLISHIYTIPKEPRIFLPWRDQDDQPEPPPSCILAVALVSATRTCNYTTTTP